MSMFKQLVTVKPQLDALVGFIGATPAWTRLEPQSVTGDPTPGLAAAVHDPLWLLLRQWQFGEFQGEDAGTPLLVDVATTSQRVSAWQPGAATSSAAKPLNAGERLDPLVENEPAAPGGPGLRPRVEASSLLLAMLAEHKVDVRATLLRNFPLAVPGAGVPPLFRTLARSFPDAEAIAEALEAAAPEAPAWLKKAKQAAREAAAEWLVWYRRHVSPNHGERDQCWISDRLEYRFRMRAGRGQQQNVFVAPVHEGGAIDWYSFDHTPDATLSVRGEPREANESERNLTMIATRVQYAGMPSDRLWQFEDGKVNLGKMEIQRYDLARLCLVQFAMVYGDDWFVVPLDIDAGGFTTVDEVIYTNCFGDRIVVPRANDQGRSGRFRLFEISRAGTSESLPGLLVPPAARRTMEGRALEEVMFLGDENANMAWAVELAVEAPTGVPRARADESVPPPPSPALEAGAELKYQLQSSVPMHWIPLVPVATDRDGGFILRKGTMTDRDESLGRLLRPMPFDLAEEELPREGLRVRRVPALVRAADGSYVRWVARRTSVGRGPGASHLAFDAAVKGT